MQSSGGKRYRHSAAANGVVVIAVLNQLRGSTIMTTVYDVIYTLLIHKQNGKVKKYAGHNLPIS